MDSNCGPLVSETTTQQTEPQSIVDSVESIINADTGGFLLDFIIVLSNYTVRLI